MWTISIRGAIQGRIRRTLSMLVFVSPLFSGMAMAEAAEDCPTWFPDLRCERSGRFEGFVIPMSQPFYFEDPFITTNAQLYGLWHQTPNSSAFEGGDIGAIALQLRIALTDRLAFIATKDGYTFTDPDKNSALGSVLDDKDGFNNLAFGFKYAVVSRPEDQIAISPTFRIEVPTGQKDVFQGRGDGVAIPGVSFAYGFEKFHFMGDLGAQLPFSNKQSDQIFFHAHFDYAVHEHFVPLVELGVIHYTAGGDGKHRVKTKPLGSVPLSAAQTVLGTGGFEAHDVANLGSKDLNSPTVVTMAVGARIPITKRVSGGAIYEFPLTDKKYLFRQRVALSLTYEF